MSTRIRHGWRSMWVDTYTVPDKILIGVAAAACWWLSMHQGWPTWTRALLQPIGWWAVGGLIGHIMPRTIARAQQWRARR